MMKKYILAGAILATTSAVFAQDGKTVKATTPDAVTQQVNKLIDPNDVERIIKTLSADDMEGRATFSPGIDRAAKFIEGEFAEIGLKPMPGKSGFRQDFHLLKSIPTKTTASINGQAIATEKVLAYGHVNFNWNNDPEVQVIKETADKNFRMDYRSFLATGKKTLVLVDPSFESAFNQMRNRAGGGSTILKPNPDLAVVFVLGSFDAVKSFDVSYEVKIEEQPKLLFNVAGIIPGKSKPDEYVIFGGHYDHLGIRKGMAGDSIFNGADDDASGTTAMISLAKYYKKLNSNARTLLFVAFTAEEIGEYGSTYFATTVHPDKVVAMFNIEMIGKASKFGINSAFITGYERSDFGKILQRNLEGTEFKFYPDPYPKEDLFYRSDNASLARVGVPAHTISTDQIDIDPYYHKAGDEFKTLDVNNITSTIRAIALSSRTIVSGKDTPTRVAKLER